MWAPTSPTDSMAAPTIRGSSRRKLPAQTVRTRLFNLKSPLSSGKDLATCFAKTGPGHTCHMRQLETKRRLRRRAGADRGRQLQFARSVHAARTGHAPRRAHGRNPPLASAQVRRLGQRLHLPRQRQRVVGRGKETHLLRHCIVKMTILPRQARDKHRVKLKTRDAFSCR
jgi:hypothetical protein